MSLNVAIEPRLAKALKDDGLARDLVTDINAVLDGSLGDTTPGTVEASKVVVVDSNKDISSFRNVGLTGDLTLASGGNLVLSGATGESEIILTDNLADALSVKISGGADFFVFCTTDSAEKLTLAQDFHLIGGKDLVFTGATGESEIHLTDNLADALSVKIAGGADFLVCVTTDSAEKINISQDVHLIGGKDLLFVGATGESEIHLTDNLADALSVKIAGGADFLVFVTTDSAEGITVGQHLTMADAKNIILNTTTGTKIGTATTQKLGFYNATPVAQPAALTAQLTTITHTAPGSDDFAIQNLTNSSPFGFVTADEGNTVLKVIANLQARLAEVEARLEALGLVAAN